MMAQRILVGPIVSGAQARFRQTGQGTHLDMTNAT
jgi:hypothetical protein